MLTKMAHALSPIENHSKLSRRILQSLNTKESCNHCNLPKDGRKKKFKKRELVLYFRQNG
jgi:hypothetical protein